MNSRTRQLFGRRRLLRALIAVFACTCPVLGGGCAKHATAPRLAPQLSGTITLMVHTTDASGTVLDSLADSSATGVEVRVLTRAGLGDSSLSVNGAFSVPVGSDSTWLLVGPSIATSDTVGPWLVSGTGAKGLSLRLSEKGFLAPAPNPVVQGASLSLTFSVTQNKQVAVRVRALDGVVVRTLLDMNLPAGVHRVIWDGKDDGGSLLAGGAYWVTCEDSRPSGGVPLAADDAVPAPPPMDSAGSRSLVRVLVIGT